MKDEEELGEEEKEDSKQREQHVQRPRGWLREKLENIQEAEGRGQSSERGRGGRALGARLRRGHKDVV